MLAMRLLPSTNFRLFSLTLVVAAALCATATPAEAYRIIGTISASQQFITTEMAPPATRKTTSGGTVTEVVAYSHSDTAEATYSLEYPGGTYKNLKREGYLIPTVFAGFRRETHTSKTTTSQSPVKECRSGPWKGPWKIWTVAPAWQETVTFDDPGVARIGQVIEHAEMVRLIRHDPSSKIELREGAKLNLTLEINLPGVHSADDQLTGIGRKVGERLDCEGSTATNEAIPSWARRPYAAGMRFTLTVEGTVSANGEIEIQRSVTSKDVSDLQLYETGWGAGWQLLKADLRLKIVDVPLAKISHTPATPVRGEAVEFKTPRSDFEQGVWTFHDVGRCVFPGDREVMEQDTRAPVLDVLNRADFDGADRRFDSTRPDEFFSFATPLLCPLRIKLEVSDAVFKSSDEVAIWNLIPRYWNGRFHDVEARLVMARRTSPPDHFDNINGQGLTALAINAMALCFADGTLYNDAECLQAYSWEGILADNLMRQLKFACVYFGEPAQDKAFIEGLPLGAKGNVRFVGGKGPFSGKCFLDQMPKVLFGRQAVAREQLYHPDFMLQNGRPSTADVTGTDFLKCVTVHELQHTRLSNLQVFATPAEFDTVLKSSSGRLRMKLFDPNKVLEKLFGLGVRTVAHRAMLVMQILFEHGYFFDDHLVIHSTQFSDEGVPPVCRRDCEYTWLDGTPKRLRGTFPTPTIPGARIFRCGF